MASLADWPWARLRNGAGEERCEHGLLVPDRPGRLVDRCVWEIGKVKSGEVGSAGFCQQFRHDARNPRRRSGNIWRASAATEDGRIGEGTDLVRLGWADRLDVDEGVYGAELTWRGLDQT